MKTNFLTSIWLPVLILVFSLTGCSHQQDNADKIDIPKQYTKRHRRMVLIPQPCLDVIAIVNCRQLHPTQRAVPLRLRLFFKGELRFALFALHLTPLFHLTSPAATVMECYSSRSFLRSQVFIVEFGHRYAGGTFNTVHPNL